MSCFGSCFSIVFKKPKTHSVKVAVTEELKPVPPKMTVFEKISSQQFPLPKPIMRYLLKNVNVEIIKKLQQTCRYFYSIFNFNIIDNLWIRAENFTKISDFNIQIPNYQTEFFQNNLYLNKKLYLQGRCNLEKLQQKIIKCDIFELHISCLLFRMNDFIFLTKFGKLEKVKISCCIYYADNSRAQLENILSLIPNVYFFENCFAEITSNTMTNLLSIKRNVKFNHIMLSNSVQFLNPSHFNDYIKEMFDFDNPSKTSLIELHGNGNVLQKLYKLVKPWRQNSMYYDYAEVLMIK